MLQWQPFALLFLGGFLVSAAVGVQALRSRRDIPSAAPLAGCMFGLAWWALAETVGACVSSAAVQGWCSRAIFPGVTIAVAGFVWFVWALAGGALPVRRRTWVLMGIEPVLMTLLAATDPWHHLVYAAMTQVGDPAMLRVRSGPALWVHTYYSYGLLGWGTYILLRHWRGSSSLFRRQAAPILIGMTFPGVANVITMVFMAKTGVVDFTVVAFVALSSLAWWTVRRHGLLRYSPVARGFVFDRVDDLLLVLDRRERVIDFNPAAEQVLREARADLPESLVGLPIRELIPPSVPVVGTGARAEFLLRTPGRTRTLDVRTSPLADHHGVPLGYVVVGRDVTALTEANRQLREQLRTIEELQHTLSEQALRDPLTGLHNRRYLTSTMTAERQRAAAGGRPFSVVLIDLDHFKRINDRFGHAIGDEVLRLTAEALMSTARAEDTIARFGGEEFVVLLPGATAEVAARRAEDWRQAVAAVRLPTPQGVVSVTFSAGVAAFPVSGADPDALLVAADLALYEAKSLGRDQTRTAPPAAATEEITR